MLTNSLIVEVTERKNLHGICTMSQKHRYVRGSRGKKFDLLFLRYPVVVTKTSLTVLPVVYLGTEM